MVRKKNIEEIRDGSASHIQELSRFDRKFFDAKEEFTYIGHGSLGGKAAGLAAIKKTLEEKIPADEFPGVTVNIPRLIVLTTSVFDSFMELNNLFETAYSDEKDNIIAHKFLNASLPAELVGDLRALIEKIHSPLAVRSSSLLEDAMYEPFAGIYGTKMIPNNQPDADSRYRKLTEAIKFVFASTFFKEAKDYIRATSNKVEDEKMAVIIQEIVGIRYNDYFYPGISGVARSYNFYPSGRAKPEDGVVDLALGLGKTVVDGEHVWTYSPAFPNLKPPYGSVNEMMKSTQNEFWAVNMGKPPAYNPMKETEYLIKKGISDAEADGTLNQIVSTYDAVSDRMTVGTGCVGPRVINFAPVLEYNTVPLNNVIKKILAVCEETEGTAVEIEFALTLDNSRGTPARFGFLQVRPMVVSDEVVEVTNAEMESDKALISSGYVLGNGFLNTINDIVYVKPDSFEAKHSPVIAAELESINKIMTGEGKKYMLIGFGRWGSSDPWLGIPVNWGQISGAKVIVESMLANMNVELSQGSHFFHNISSFQVSYFSMPLRSGSKGGVDWHWLDSQKIVNETGFVKHIELENPLRVKVDGRRGRGVIFK